MAKIRRTASVEPRIVELFGLPGAGKTTVTTALAQTMQFATRDDLSVAWRALPRGQKARIGLSAIADREWVSVLSALVRATPLRHPEGLSRLLRLAFNKPWLRSQEHDPVVLDQGLLQRLWSIFFTEKVVHPPHDLLVRLVRQFYAEVPVTIVFLDIGPEVAAGRVYGRKDGSSRLDPLPEDAVLRQLAASRGLVGSLLAAARDAGIEVVELDAAQSPAALAAQVRSIVEQDCPSAPCPASAGKRPPGI